MSCYSVTLWHMSIWRRDITFGEMVYLIIQSIKILVLFFLGRFPIIPMISKTRKIYQTGNGCAIVFKKMTIPVGLWDLGLRGRNKNAWILSDASTEG